MPTDFRAGSQVFASKDRIQVYSAPFRDSERLLKTNTTKNSYRDWKQGDLIGIATGQMAVTGTGELGTFVEVNVQLGRWRKRLVDWVREDVIGYLCVGENSFSSYIDNPALTTDIPKDYVPPVASNKTQTYFIIGAVLLVVITLIFAARKGKF